MTKYLKEEIRAGIYFEKDCPIVVKRRDPVRYGEPAPSLEEISRRIERLREKLAVVQSVAANRVRQ